MQPFAYERPNSGSDAIAAIKAPKGLPPTAAPSRFIAGGTNILDTMKLGIERPDRLVDINGLAPIMSAIELSDTGLRLGALVRMADAANHPEILTQYPVIAESLKLAASAQIRNMASLGGNILQRTRCEYFREASWPCNKRVPGSGCSALDGVNRQHAILGTSEHCIATYPGDFAQALIALDATIETIGSRGRRSFPLAELHKQPGERPDVETTLAPDEMIVAITVPAGSWTRRSHYLKIRDRDSYQFALASAAVALDLDGDVVRHVRIGLGGVATTPWRAHAAEDALQGKTLDEPSARAAAELAFADAKPRGGNAYKVELGKQTLTRALIETKMMRA